MLNWIASLFGISPRRGKSIEAVIAPIAKITEDLKSLSEDCDREFEDKSARAVLLDQEAQDARDEAERARKLADKYSSLTA